MPAAGIEPVRVSCMTALGILREKQLESFFTYQFTPL